VFTQNDENWLGKESEERPVVSEADYPQDNDRDALPEVTAARPVESSGEDDAYSTGESESAVGMDSDADDTKNSESEEESEEVKKSVSSGNSDERRFEREIPELSETELDAVADVSIEIVRKVLAYFDAEEAEIDEYEGDDGELIFDIIGEDLAVLIGRHGATLDALQYIVLAIVSKRIGYRYPIVVDIEGYVHRRRQKLVNLAKSSAAKAIRQNRDVRLRPMNPYERRIVHMVLKEDERVNTVSEGQDPNRLVVITLV
jgi:spoIIIJ-associated protein